MSALRYVNHVCILFGAILCCISTAENEPDAFSSADAFVESIGINTHFGYTDTVYFTKYETVKTRLADSGIRYVRDKPYPESWRLRTDLYTDLGIQFMLIAGQRDSLGFLDPANVSSVLEKCKQYGEAVFAVMGANEYDINCPAEETAWWDTYKSYQQELYNQVKADPDLQHLPVVMGPTAHAWNAYTKLAGIGGMLDYGAMHPYPGGNSPEYGMVGELDYHYTATEGKPLYASESGYHNALLHSKGISEATQAKYLPRMYAGYFRMGVKKFFKYELCDGGTDPAIDGRNWGILRHDLSEKPAYFALKNMISLLEDPGPDFSPAPVDFSLLGDTESLRTLTLRKRDGRVYLLIWQEVPVFDIETKQEIINPRRTIQLETAFDTAQINVYEPVDSADPLATYENLSSCTLSVPDSLMIVEITPWVTIRNRWTGRYAADGGDRVIYTNYPDSEEAQWVLKPVSGSTHFRIKNRGTGHFIDIRNLPGYAECSLSDPGTDWSAQWSLLPTDKNKVNIQCAWQPTPGDVHRLHVQDKLGYVQHSGLRTSAWSTQWSIETAASNTLQTIEYGSVVIDQLNSWSWKTVYPGISRSDPIVIATTSTANDPDPCTVRVRNVTANSFQVQLDEWDYQDGVHGPEVVEYLVMDRGLHFVDGVMLEAGSTTANHQTSKVNTTAAMRRKTIILPQVVTVNGGAAVTPRLDVSSSSASFDLYLQEEEAQDGIHNQETVHWVSVQAGVSGKINGKPFKTISTEADNSRTTVDYETAITDPFVFGNSQSVNGSDCCTLRISNSTENSVEIRIEEEQSADTETTHNKEAVGLLILSGPVPALSNTFHPAGGNLQVTTREL